MELTTAFGAALRDIRLAKGLAQEALGSSQNFVSNLERGKKLPSLEKVIQLSAHLGIHPMTMIAQCYITAGASETELLEIVGAELEMLKLSINGEAASIQVDRP